MSGFVQGTSRITVPELPYHFQAGGVVVYKNFIHILGGYPYDYSEIYKTKAHYVLTSTGWEQKPDLPYEFYRGCAVVYNNKIHILGSHDSDENGHKHYSWDGTSWTQESTLPLRFSMGGAVVYNNKIHILGGFTRSNYHYSWDGTSWVFESTLPYDVYQSGVVVYNNKIHILGSWFLSERSKHYSWDGTSWTQESTLPFEYASSSVITYNNKIHVLGTMDGSSSNYAISYNHYEWDGTSWVQKNDMPITSELSEEMGSVVYDNKINILRLTYHYIYDESNDLWGTTLNVSGSPKKMRKGWIEAADKSKLYKVTNVKAIPCSGIVGQVCNSVVYDDDIYVFSSQSIYDRLYIYHNSSWSEWGLPYSMRSASYIVYNGKLHIMGGGWNDEQEARYHYTLESISFTNYTIDWHREEDLPFDLLYSSKSTIIYNNKIYIVGGKFTSQSLYSYDGTTWTLEATLPYECVNASAVVYNNKIQIVGCNDYPDSHYSWNGSTWSRESTMSFNNYGGPAIEYRGNIHIIYGNDHYVWRGYEWTRIADTPAYYSQASLIIYDNILHLIGYALSGYTPAESNHYVYNWSDHIWGTDINIKEIVQLNNISIHDTIIYETSKKRIRKGWVGELNREPKLVLQNVPVIDHARELGYNLPNSLSGNDGCYYRVGAVSYDRRIHILGGQNNVHYSFSVTYNSDGDPIVLDCVKELPIPYEFRGDTVAVLDGEIHVFGSAYSSQYVKYHYAYNGGSWRQISDSSTMPSIYSNYCVTVSTLTRVYIFYHNDIYIYSDSGTWTKYTNVLPFYVDNATHYGHQGAVYDPDNGRIILVDDYNMNTVKFYSLSLNSSSATLLKTINNEQFLHPLYVDTDVIPNGGEENLYVLGGAPNANYENNYKFISVADEWDYGYILPYSFKEGSVVLYNDKIHILGGSGSGNPTNHYSYNSGNSWTSESTLPYNFYDGSAVVYNNKIHIMGGSYMNKYHYSWNGSSWAQESTLPFAFVFGTAVVYNNKIHILGSNISAASSKYHYSWDGTSWTQESTLPYEGMGSVFVVFNGKIHMLGGDKSNEHRYYHYSWNGSSWIEESSLPYAFCYGFAAVYGNRLHILGGGSSSASDVHYSWNGGSWRSEDTLPNGVSGTNTAITKVTQQEKFIIGWTNGDSSYGLMGTGLSAFPTSNPNMTSYGTWSWKGQTYGPLNNYKPAVTLTHNGRIYMINVDMDTSQIALADLTFYSYNEGSMSAVFNQHNCNVLGMINPNGLVYNKNELYTYGGEYRYRPNDVLKNTLYVYEYNDSRRRWYKKQLSTMDPAGIPGTYFVNLNNDKNVSVIHKGSIIIFDNAIQEYDTNNNVTNLSAFIKITYDLSTNYYKMKHFSSYSMNFDLVNGAFSYNDKIYLLGGLVAENHEWYNYLMKFDDTSGNDNADNWSTCGRKWDWQNNAWISSPVRIPRNSNNGNKLNTFTYEVIDDHLHMLYVDENNVNQHKVFNLATEANDLYGEHPISEPLYNSTPPPEGFNGVSFVSDMFIFVVCVVNSQYKVYYLDEDEWKVVDNYLGVPDDILLMTLHQTESLVQNIEIVANSLSDGLTSQYEPRLDEYFN